MIQTRGKQLIQKAVSEGVHDLYLIPSQGQYECFVRQSDERQFYEKIDFSIGEQLISHFKFLAGMNVGEKRRPQLGACDYVYEADQTVMIRLSTVGDYLGQESLVVRFLHNKKKELRFWFDRPQDLVNIVTGRGLYLFAGPVGSGKTSLMHYLAEKRFSQKQVMSIEDPVEIRSDQILQLQLNETIGMTYDNLIKLSLRHRPDLLIIGEIRDSETAQAVIRASLTGATVFSTIHAKSIPGVYARLRELGVSPKEIDNSLQAIIYQRLIKGGGVIDYATERFDQHKPDKWNQKMADLVDQGHLTRQEQTAEEIRAEERKESHPAVK